MIFGCLSIQCAPSFRSGNSQTNSINRRAEDATLTNAESNSGDLEDTKHLESLMQQFLKRESLRLGIGNLREVPTDDGTEIRIWVGFGIGYPRCFILKTLDGKYKAVYVAPTNDTSRGNSQVKRPSFEKTPLDAPRSGWDELGGFLKEEGIAIPIKLSLDQKSLAGLDEEFIVVEAKSAGLYDMIFYPLSTKSKDGQKTLNVCRRIEQEFSIRMGCG